MQLLTKLGNIFMRATEGVKNMADLDVDQQFAELDKRLEKERMAEADRIRNAYPAGWFKMTRANGSEQLVHWCPTCKELSEGKTVNHGGVKVVKLYDFDGQELKVKVCAKQVSQRPEGWRLALLPKTRPVLFV